MKKTLTINISGSIFHIDEDAFDKLQSYLRTLNQHYGSGEEGREIITDIEARIAEIFQEKLSSKGQVVNVEMVEEVISIMGNPEEIFATDDESSEQETTSTTSAQPNGKKKRRLYRDPDHRVLGGVSSGLAAYFGIDVVFIRLLFALFFIVGYGFSFILYIILWIVVPKAITTTQKLEMKGKKVNISNIEESIKDEYKDVKENFDKMREKNGPQVKDGFDRAIDFLGSALRLLLKVVIILLGVGFIFAGFVSLISFIGSMIFAHSFFGPFADFHFPGAMFPKLFLDGTSITLFTIGIITVIAIPLMLLIFAGIKLLFNFKTNNKIIGFTALAVWLTGIILLISLSFSQVKGYMHSSTRYAETHDVKAITSDTLYLKTTNNIGDDWFEGHIDFDQVKVYINGEEEMIVGEPTLDIERSYSDNFEIKLRKKARGSSRSSALDNAKGIDYKWIQNDSLIVFDRFFTLGEENKWRNQRLHITVKVPEGKVVYFDDSMGKIIHDIDNVTNTWDFDMLDQKWIMEEEGLSPLY
ncbi:PspC domain-containing protein [Marinifilum sp. N1E240]|uniref:PspC domain-containing protein n=1 Tax=Marinifilum sp. N1E240 TaxID=2608082 RepID=UPI00128CAF82|nr:PspC domain-containing protein [Marinifilum sp. N1E240]MPQ45416.1 PspC domain-containing protein [Marinifilum sp. N1E240]